MPSPVANASNSGRKVIVMGQVCNWEEKAPFVPSGKSVKGAVEYDSKRDRVRCHECGGWFKQIGPHLKVHQITHREYKLNHGLRMSTSLSSPSYHEQRSRVSRRVAKHCLDEFRYKRGRRVCRSDVERRAKTQRRENSERRNFAGTCPAQLLKRIAAIAADMGRTPSEMELRSLGINTLERTFGSIKRAQELAGLTPNSPGGQLGSRNAKFGEAGGYSKAILIELLRDFFVLNRRVPLRGDWRAGLLPSPRTYVRHFGSLGNAYRDAGLLNRGVQAVF